MGRHQQVVNNVQTDNLADILERVLDKGIVIAGDIRIRLVDVELLTIQIRLLVASVDKAKEMGINWWENNSFYGQRSTAGDGLELAALRARIAVLEGAPRPPLAPVAEAVPEGRGAPAALPLP